MVNQLYNFNLNDVLDKPVKPASDSSEQAWRIKTGYFWKVLKLSGVYVYCMCNDSLLKERLIGLPLYTVEEFSTSMWDNVYYLLLHY